MRTDELMPDLVMQLPELSQREGARYSYGAAIEAARIGMHLGGSLEHDYDRAVCQALGREHFNPHSIYAPLTLRRLDTTNAGAIVGTQQGGLIDYARRESIAMRLGAVELPNLAGNLALPKGVSDPTVTWLGGEAAQAADSQPQLGSASMTPKGAAALTFVSHQFAVQAQNPGAQEQVLRILGAAVGTAVDAGVIAGAGASGQPTGIINTGGIGSVSGSSLAAAGLVELQADVAASNGLRGSLGYATTPAVAQLLAGRQRFTGTDSPLWQGALAEGEVIGARALSSLQVPTATMIFGDWSSVLVGLWAVELAVDPYSGFRSGRIGLRVITLMDCLLTRPGSFSIASSIT